MSAEEKAHRRLDSPIVAINEEYHDPCQDAARIAIANGENQRRHALAAAGALGLYGNVEELVHLASFPVLVSQAVIIPYEKTSEGQLIWSITTPLQAIIERIMKNPSLMYEVDPRKWEEIIAATYDESGQFDEVILTARCADRGRDVIAVKNGFGSVRLIESVKRYTPGHVVTAEEVQALLGVLHGDHQASKGIVSTTWRFAPKICENRL